MIFNPNLIYNQNPRSLESWEFEEFQYTREIIQRACILTRLVGDDLFTDKVALFCAGIDWETIENNHKLGSNLFRYMNHIKQTFDQNYGAKSSYLGDSSDQICERYVAFVSFAERWPKIEALRNFNGMTTPCDITRVGALGLIGAEPEMRKTSHGVYSKCTRLDKQYFEDKKRGSGTKGSEAASDSLSELEEDRGRTPRRAEEG